MRATHLYCYIYIHICVLNVSSLEIQNPPVWVPVSRALGDPPLDWTISRGPFQHQWFCDSVHMRPAGPHLLQRGDTDQDYSKYNFFLIHNGTTESTISCNDISGFELLKFHPSRNSHFLLCHRVWIILLDLNYNLKYLKSFTQSLWILYLQFIFDIA